MKKSSLSKKMRKIERDINKEAVIIEMKDWPNKVLISIEKSQFYTNKHRLPKKYKPILKQFGTRFLYVDDKGKPIVKNANRVGKENWWSANGQDFYTANVHWSTRSKIKNFYGSYFKNILEKQLPKNFGSDLEPENRYKIKMTIHTDTEVGIPDITNMWIIHKIFEDTLVKNSKLQDDAPRFINQAHFKYLISDEKKLVFKITKNKVKCL